MPDFSLGTVLPMRRSAGAAYVAGATGNLHVKHDSFRFNGVNAVVRTAFILRPSDELNVGGLPAVTGNVPLPSVSKLTLAGRALVLGVGQDGVHAIEGYVSSHGVLSLVHCLLKSSPLRGDLQCIAGMRDRFSPTALWEARGKQREEKSMDAFDLLDENDALENARFNDINLLIPRLRPVARNILHALNTDADRRHLWGIFETWRSPTRQLKLLKEGRSKTQFSAHNIGAAFDIVPLTDEGHWFWEAGQPQNKRGIAPDWGLLDLKVAQQGGVVTRPIQWDRPHVELANWQSTVRKMLT